MTNNLDDAELRRRFLGAARRVVVKVGSQLLRESPAGRPATLADELAALRAERDLEVVVVSSGAISSGMSALSMTERPTDMPVLQAVAAVGQGALWHRWQHAFAAHGVLIGQVLLTHDDIRDRRRFLNARHALEAMIDMSVVPIVNENDTVAVEEIKYGDNDVLAALVCNLIGADALVILTDVDGLHDGDPRAGGSRIPVVRDIDTEAARMCGRSGAAAAVVSGRDPGAVRRVLSGEDVGTLFAPRGDRLTSRKHWILYGPKPVGQIHVDEGARAAVVDKARSLLPAGVTQVTGEFGIGDTVSVVDSTGVEFARGLTSYSADEVRRIAGVRSSDIDKTLGYKYVDEVICRDDLVLL